MNVSVLIVNYNTKELVSNCLSSVYQQTVDIDFEVIVVDNASEDGSQEMIKSRYPEVVLIESQTNLGFGRANNAGARIAKGKYLFLLNSDTELINNAIKLFFDYMEQYNQNRKIGAIGALLLNRDNEIIHSYGRFPSIRNNSLLLPLYRKRENRPFAEGATDFDVEYVTGADLFIPTDIFNEMNGFDEKFFMYFEETDLQYRMKNRGLERKIINGPLIYHLESGSFGKENRMSNKKKLLMKESLNIFLKKHHTKLYQYIYKIYDRLVDMKIILNSITHRK
ncbi:MAG: glycosyltransferase family 2 protein [Porphyromonadaceae bacterium]|nr:glycosyltransferase family 2 protein [Porphyromonadaceae bacterium]